MSVNRQVLRILDRHEKMLAYELLRVTDLPTDDDNDPAFYCMDLDPYPNIRDRPRPRGADQGRADGGSVMPTLTEPIFLQCGHPIEPVQMGAARRCMVPLNQHGGLDHEYVSLMVPCLHCPMAIDWRDGAWRDSHGDTGHHARYYRDFHDARIALAHEPDPSYVR